MPIKYKTVEVKYGKEPWTKFQNNAYDSSTKATPDNSIISVQPSSSVQSVDSNDCTLQNEIENNVIEATDDYGFIESTYFNKSGNV